MTYSHNSVSNNFKMTAAAANTSTKTIRLKSGGGGGGGGGASANGHLKRNSSSKTHSASISAPSAPISTAHSNSIASSTNHHPSLSTSPTGSLSSGSSTCSSSAGSTSSAGFFAYRQRQQQQQRNWQQQEQMQRQSPTSMGGGGGAFFSNNNNSQFYHQGVKQYKQSGGSAQKQRENQRSPQNRPSPVLVLAGGAGVAGGVNVNNSGGSGRKPNRSKPTGSPLQCAGPMGGGKLSPTHPLIPTALTHFAGSKCFDAPAPTALPKPPQHWTLSKSDSKLTSSAGSSGLLGITMARSCASLMKNADAHTFGGHIGKTSKRNLLDDFDTHNLKLLLNVQS